VEGNRTPEPGSHRRRRRALSWLCYSTLFSKVKAAIDAAVAARIAALQTGQQLASYNTGAGAAGC
jgi:hypothetical protein